MSFVLCCNLLNVSNKWSMWLNRLNHLCENCCSVRRCRPWRSSYNRRWNGDSRHFRPHFFPRPTEKKKQQQQQPRHHQGKMTSPVAEKQKCELTRLGIRYYLHNWMICINNSVFYKDVRFSTPPYCEMSLKFWWPSSATLGNILLNAALGVMQNWFL